MAATARVGQAKAEYFSLTGDAGRESTELHLLALGGGNFFSFGATISVPVFTAGRIGTGGAHEGVDHDLQSTVLTALEETENALVGYSNEQDRRDRLVRAAKADGTVRTRPASRTF